MVHLTTRVYLLRHGEVATPEIHYGHTDVPLSARGRQQAEDAAVRLASLELAAAYSSDLRRAAIGAALIASHHDIEARTDSALREMHLGVLEGLPHRVSRTEHPQLHAKSYRDLLETGFPGGESLQTVAARSRPTFEAILKRHAGQTVAVVAHNSVNRILLADALGLPLAQMFSFQQDYGCINWIDYSPDGTRVGLLNWTPDAPCREAGGGRHPP